MPANTGDLCAVDIFGPLPVGRGGVRYILVCLEVFSKFVKLYPLRAATTRTCLSKIVAHYVVHVTRPKCILSDKGTQFASPTWGKKLAELGINVRFSPVRQPQANPKACSTQYAFLTDVEINGPLERQCVLSHTTVECFRKIRFCNGRRNRRRWKDCIG
jgi:transposase InsO family protein